MAEDDVRYYILFTTHEQGMALHQLFREQGIVHRIAPAPRAIQGKLSCGMSLLLAPEQLKQAEQCIADNQAEYYAIVPLANQIKAHRDKYC